jgi:hypothetical protein
VGPANSIFPNARSGSSRRYRHIRRATFCWSISVRTRIIVNSKKPITAGLRNHCTRPSGRAKSTTSPFSTSARSTSSVRPADSPAARAIRPAVAGRIGIAAAIRHSSVVNSSRRISNSAGCAGAPIGIRSRRSCRLPYGSCMPT